MCESGICRGEAAISKSYSNSTHALAGSSVKSLGSPSQTASSNAATSKPLGTPSKFKLGRALTGSGKNSGEDTLEKAVAGMSVRDKNERVEVVYLVSGHQAMAWHHRSIGGNALADATISTCSLHAVRPNKSRIILQSVRPTTRVLNGACPCPVSIRSRPRFLSQVSFARAL